MKRSHMHMSLKFNNYVFNFNRDDETKLWTFENTNHEISMDSIEVLTEVYQTVTRTIHILNKSSPEQAIELMANGLETVA
jgi:hypothetical protein